MGGREMAIFYSDTKRIFNIETANTSYQMIADPHGVLLHLYYGKKAAGEMDYLLTYYDRGFSGSPYDLGNNRTYSLDALPQEYPTEGTGDFRSPALVVEYEDGFRGCDLRYVDYKIVNEKYHIPGLPAVYGTPEEAFPDETEHGEVPQFAGHADEKTGYQTLEIHLKDRFRDLDVYLLYGVIPELDIITRSVRIENNGEQEVCLLKALAANLDFVTGDYDILSFYGRHGMERNLQRCSAGHGEFRIGSRRGTSSHEYNPLLILSDHDTTERAGMCWAMEFVYSGGFNASVEKDQYNQTRVQMGLAQHDFEYPLMGGDVFYVPEVILSASYEGFGKLSQNLRDCVQEHVIRGTWKDEVRPVLLNSWEGFYFDFDGQKIRNLAREAKDLGMDMLVLDDGWFGKRNDDNSGLGDWSVNEKKLGGTLKSLVDDIHAMGLKFGIWFEPEMVNEDSDLYRKHPEWVLMPDGRKPVRGRNQLVLDFSRPEVVDDIYEQVAKVVRQGVDYLKWDYNRSIADVYSHAARYQQEFQSQGTVLYDYVIGLYRFLERLNREFPNLLIEGCSGGGGRFDAGMLYYTPQIWCSDNTDAIDRLKIQYGTSFGYPISAVGAHVSAVPNEQTGRVTSLAVRGAVAMAGTFGYELNPAKLTESEKREIRLQIRERNRVADLISHGAYFRLSDPFQDPAAAWEFLARDRKRVLVNVVTQDTHCNMPITYVRCAGLESGALYRDVKNGKVYPADGLMNVGIPIPNELGEYRAYSWDLELI